MYKSIVHIRYLQTNIAVLYKYFKSVANLSLYWDWAFVEFAFEAAKDQFYRTKKQLRTKWNK